MCESTLPPENETNKQPRKLHSTNETIVWRVPGESWACLRSVFDSYWIHPSSGCDDTDMWCLVEQVVFLTVYHRGPLPLRELHSTDETKLWRDPGGSWACLRPVSDSGWIRFARSCDTDMHVASLWSRSFFLRWITADPSPWGNFTPPTKHECGETLGDLEPVYDLFPITGENYSHCQKLWHRHVCGITAKQVVFLTVNHRGPFPWRELHSTDEIWVWRDPGGS